MNLTVDIENDGIFEEVQIPTKFEVCSRCRGKGTHVNPAVDGNGIGQEEFDEDPDFQEAYFSGVYDVTCQKCEGERVEKVPDFDRMTPEMKEAWKEDESSRREFAHWQRSIDNGMGY